MLDGATSRPVDSDGCLGLFIERTLVEIDVRRDLACYGRRSQFSLDASLDLEDLGFVQDSDRYNSIEFPSFLPTGNESILLFVSFWGYGNDVRIPRSAILIVIEGVSNLPHTPLEIPSQTRLGSY